VQCTCSLSGVKQTWLLRCGRLLLTQSGHVAWATGQKKEPEGGAEALFTKPIDFGALRSEIDTRVTRAA
jgi:hypothetical protein